MLEDNQGCTALAENPMTSQKSKHIDIRYHFVRDLVKSKVMVMEYCETTNMLADALTKFSLPTSLFLKHVGRMLSGTYSGPPSV